MPRKKSLPESLPGRSLAAALTLAAVLPAGAADVVHREKSLYRNIYVLEGDGERCMSFGRYSGSRQTCIDLARPERLAFEYYRMMMGALYLNPAPQRVLVIGLGGGALPMALQRLYPALKMDVVEIDPAVARIAERHFGFRPGPLTRVAEEDGRVFVKRALKQGLKYDLVMLDAFDHEYVPEHLLTLEFLNEVRGVLVDGGVVAANTFSYSRLQQHETATYFAAFGAFYNLKSGNRIILARKGAIPSLEQVGANAAALDPRLKPLGISREELLGKFALQKEAPRDTRVLTDQYSPSNLLNRK